MPAFRTAGSDSARRGSIALAVLAALASFAACGSGGGDESADGSAPSTDASPDLHDSSVEDSSVDAGPGLDASAPADASVEAGPDAQTLALTVTAVDTTFSTEDHFIAAVEMQLSGEPFAEAMGRDLGGYARDYSCQESVCSPSTYDDPSVTDGGPSVRIDLAGFSSAVESYEYSKQPMNNIAFESGAGTSLLFGPVLNPNGVTGAAALKLAQDWFTHMAAESNATSRFVQDVSPSNPLGWRGLWPTLQPFSSWDPSIQPANNAVCSISSDDNRGSRGAFLCDIYECDYSSLHLQSRATQVSMAIGPGSSGWADWKEALWTLNYLQVMHDPRETGLDTVPTSQLTSVGVPGNTVVAGLIPGMYLGSSDIEGFQAGNFLQILDNQAAQWLLQLTTADGTTLGGFASLSAALTYSPTNPLRWFPASIHVTEVADASGFPMPSSYTIASPDSHLLDLAGLLGAYGSVYSLTDQSNADVGGSQSALVYFDGDPFPVQNQTPDGEPTLHDRALAMIRVLVVNVDRLHTDPATGLFVDDATIAGADAGASVTRGTKLSADVAAYALLGLRTARRALDSELTLYSNTKPDSQGIPSPLDGFSPVDGVTFAKRLDQLIVALSGVFYDKLTTADGLAYSGWDVTSSVATDTGSNLDAHTAAIRGLLTAYLATGSTKYRDRAASVFARLERSFYDPSARVYRATAGDRSAQVTFTPRRFGLLQAALRDMYELVAVLPGQTIGDLIEDRVGRLNKLVLNGWDDRDGDQVIEWPSECAHLGTGPDGKPLGLGGLQMAERVLTGESGSVSTNFDAGARVIATDREHDCVPEISAAHLPAALANSVTFTLTPWSPANEGQIVQEGGVASLEGGATAPDSALPDAATSDATIRDAGTP